MVEFISVEPRALYDSERTVDAPYFAQDVLKELQALGAQINLVQQQLKYQEELLFKLAAMVNPRPHDY